MHAVHPLIMADEVHQSQMSLEKKTDEWFYSILDSYEVKWDYIDLHQY